jgi:hypothetical protein
MKTPDLITPPIVAFGSLEDGICGLLVAGTEPALVLAQLAADAVPTTLAVVLSQDGGDDDATTVSGDGIALRLSSPIPATTTADDDGALTLRRLAGTATIAGAERELDHGAVSCAGLNAGRASAMRLAAGFFPGDADVALLAIRPDGAKGQDRDEIAAVIGAEPAGMTIFDPKLSTTYSGSGVPLKMGLELWVGESEEGDQFPRRTAGEALGASAELTAGGVHISARALRCHARGEEGAGMYLLVRSA